MREFMMTADICALPRHTQTDKRRRRHHEQQQSAIGH